MLRPFSIGGRLLIAALLFSSIGCTHRLEIKNLSQYRATTISPLTKKVSIGIVTSDNDVNVRQLVRQIGVELQNYSGDIILPYLATNPKKVDVIADIRVAPEYKGSGMNFLINFPGFLIWAPAWHGYNYTVTYNVDVTLLDSAKNEKIDAFSLPIVLNVRHAEADRTWTEISWFEVGAIALIGGLYCTSYDPDVTPIVAEAAKTTVGEHVASEIVQRINNSGRFVFLMRLTDDLTRWAWMGDGNETL